MVKYLSVPLAIASTVGVTLAGLGALYAQSQASINRVALADAPKGVTAVAPERVTFRPQRRYVGTLHPWVTAKLGPQVLSAHVEEVLVRPGAPVKKGELLASLDCRKASAARGAVAMQARALEARQKAVTGEAVRVKKLLEGGFVSENDVEQKQAQSAAEQAQLLALRSQLAGKALEADDCALRAPFDGEVSDRGADPGAFARPGSAVLTVIDRSTIRLSIDVPETDHAAVAPGTAAQIRLLATHQRASGAVSRRSPAADAGTRTIHAEIDLPDPQHLLPVGTTAEVTVEVGEPAEALRIPVSAAKVRGAKATLFIVEGEVARSVSVKVLGEAGGDLYIAPSLPAGAWVVTEGRGLLIDGDRVAARIEPLRGALPVASASGSASGSAAPRPPPPPLPPPPPFPGRRPRVGAGPERGPSP